jgi:hypothetical protein
VQFIKSCAIEKIEIRIWISFVTDYKLSADASKWSAEDKENKKLMKAAGSQLAFVVCGHTMRSSWTLRARIQEKLDAKDLLDVFQKIKSGRNLKPNPTNWIEAIVRNNAQATAINKKHQKDDIFAELPDEQCKTTCQSVPAAWSS